MIEITYPENRYVTPEWVVQQAIDYDADEIAKLTGNYEKAYKEVSEMYRDPDCGLTNAALYLEDRGLVTFAYIP